MATEIRKGDRAPGARSVKDIQRRGSTALYGRSGSGKTTLSATWPKPILYFNILDNGDDSIRDEDGVDVVEIESSEQLEEQMLWLAKQAAKKKLIYKTVVADTVTQLQGILVAELGEKKKLGKGKKAGDFGTLTKQDWGSIAGDLKAFIMDLRNLPVESVFICQERIFSGGSDEEDDGLGQIEPEVGPKLMPSVKNDLNASVSIIGNTFIRLKVKTTEKDGKKSKEYKKVYCLRIGPNEVYTTKIRKPKGIEAPDYITDPTFAKIKKIMKGSK